MNHDIVIAVATAATPTFAVLLGAFWNNRRIDRLEDQINARFERVEARFDLVDAELRYFHQITGRHDGQIGSLEKRLR